MSSPSDLDPMSPDAPIIALLSVRDNPLLATATPEQLREFVSRCRTLATSPQALSAKLAEDKPKTPRASARRPTLSANQKQALLDSL